MSSGAKRYKKGVHAQRIALYNELQRVDESRRSRNISGTISWEDVSEEDRGFRGRAGRADFAEKIRTLEEEFGDISRLSAAEPAKHKEVRNCST